MSGVESLRSDERIILYRHEERLGRQSVFEFPGWYRSFTFGVRYGVAHGFAKIIHVESDAHLISRRLHDFVNNMVSGWVAVWSQKYSMPEIAIQVAVGKGLQEMSAFAAEPYETMRGQNHELMFPFSEVVREFKGDRYGEDPACLVPRDADYSSQTLIGKEPKYYWWLPPCSQPEPRHYSAPFEDLRFVKGWASPDPALSGWWVSRAS